jgi:hypothetical protein
MNRFLVFGPYRSGTTLIQRILNNCDEDVLCLGESGSLLYKFYEIYTVINNGHFTPMNENDIKSRDVFEPWTSLREKSELLDQINDNQRSFLTYLYGSGIRRWIGSKEVSVDVGNFVDFFEYIHLKLNYSKIFFVKRDPESILKSRINASWATPEMLDVSWQKSELNKIIDELSKQELVLNLLGSDKVHILVYEEFSPTYLKKSLDNLLDLNFDIDKIAKVLNVKLGSSYE